MSNANDIQNPAMKLTALAVEDAALLISKAAGKTVSADMIRIDINAGAPVNPDGTINLINYIAWLVKELANRGN
jgi:hypothetical protein